MDYTSLKSSVANWLARSDMVDADLATIVQLAEARIARNLRVIDMESVFFGNLDADAKVAVPADYLEFKELGLYEGGGSTSAFNSFSTATRIARIQRTTGEVLLDQITGSRGSVPSRMARIGGYFAVAPIPNGTYSLGGIYYARPVALATSGTSTLLTKHPDLYLCATLAEAAAFIQDADKTTFWGGRYDALLTSIQATDDMEATSGTMPVTYSGVG